MNSRQRRKLRRKHGVADDSWARCLEADEREAAQWKRHRSLLARRGAVTCAACGVLACPTVDCDGIPF
jgi:hypothetical protein